MINPADMLNIYGPGDDDYGRKKMIEPENSTAPYGETTSGVGIDDFDEKHGCHTPNAHQLAGEIAQALATQREGFEKKIKQFEQMVEDSVTGKRIAELEKELEISRFEVKDTDRHLENRINSLHEAGHGLAKSVMDVYSKIEDVPLRSWREALAKWEKASKEGK
jgi:hypothetical protein